MSNAKISEKIKLKKTLPVENFLNLSVNGLMVTNVLPST